MSKKEIVRKRERMRDKGRAIERETMRDKERER
jgi:hypothetical protein